LKCFALILTVGRSSLKNLADPGIRSLLNRVKQLVAFDGQIEVWAEGLSFANVFSHPHEDNLEALERSARIRTRASADHLFRTFLLKRFLQSLSQFGYAHLDEGDAIFVVVQQLATSEP
jgi:hypothetical protein